MELFLGIDVGTQSVKCIVIDCDSGRIAAESSVNFGRDLPQYASPNGFLQNENPLIRQADPLMWLDALELAFRHLAGSGIPLSAVRGISGSGQQHGTVYLSGKISSLNSKSSPAEQIRPKLARSRSPIWMDRSTAGECRELDARFGERLRRDTGSPAVERFSGPQIRKFAKEDPDAYRRTERIHLVSSFLCSVLCGSDAPIDFGDGAGMNLLNLNTLRWDGEIAEFTAPGLEKKLPPVLPSCSIAGALDPYFAKYGFEAGIPVVVWSGDNPNSLVGVGAAESGCVGISLGTSDTLFAPMRRFKTDPDGCGHVFGNPAGGFMSLICFSNGSLAREKVRDSLNVSWEFFDHDACARTPAGNGGRLILPYFEPESTPLVLSPRVCRNYREASAAEEVRALLESQALSLRLHSEWLGEKFHRIRLTGGASGSEGLRQILADVFQAEVETISVTNSAGLGAAIRAANTVAGIPLERLYALFCRPEKKISPNPENRILYDDLLERFRSFEKSALIS